MSTRKRNSSKTRTSATPTTPGPAAADSSAGVNSATPQRGGQQVIAGNGPSPGTNARAGPDAAAMTSEELAALRVGDQVIRRDQLHTVLAIDYSMHPPSYLVRNEVTKEQADTEGRLLSLPKPAPAKAAPAKTAPAKAATTLPAPKPKYSARDPSAGFLAVNPDVPKIDPDAFSTWKGNFILRLHRTLQGMRFKELKSVIEETEVGGTSPAVQRFTEVGGEEVVEAGNPRTDVAEYGLQFVEALRANKEMALPVNPKSKAYAIAVEDKRIALDVLYALLQQACKDKPDALFIVNSHGSDGNGPWQAWKTLVLKFEPLGSDRTWRALDALYAGPTSANPADRDAELAVIQVRLSAACDGDSEKEKEAIRLYTLYYLPAIERGNADLAQRVRERMTTDRMPVTVENWRTTWYAITAGDNVGQPATVQANFVRQQSGASKAAGASASRPTGPQPRLCANCKREPHRAAVCPYPCSRCGCDKQVPLPTGASLLGHYPGCVVLQSNDALAKLVTITGGPTPVRAARDHPIRHNQAARGKQREQIHSHVVQYVELLGRTEDPTAKAALLDYIADGKRELERIRIAEDVEAANFVSNMVATGSPPVVPPFGVDQSGYDSGYDRANSGSRKPPVSEPSASGTAPVHSKGPSIFLSRQQKSVRTVPALLTAAAIALMASFGGASIPQLVPGSYSVKRVPYLQSSGQPLPVPPAGTQWSSVVVDSGCSVSVFDSPDKFRALYPSKTYLQTADKSQRIFDQRGTVVLPAVDHSGTYSPLVVKHAICGPGFHNLLSVSDVLESYPNGQVVFNNSNPFIEVQPGVRIPIQRSGRLFYLTPL